MKPIMMAMTAMYMACAAPVCASQTISLAQIPMISESAEEGIFVDLVRAISDVSGVEFDIVVYPFPRSIKSVAMNESVAHLPLLDPENGGKPGPGLMFSTGYTFEAEFSIFQRVDSAITADNVASYRVETNPAHVDFFDFEIGSSSCIACSLKKVVAGRLDAVISSNSQTERTIASEGITGIRWQRYKTYKVKFVIRDGDTETDQILTDAISVLRESGRLYEILAPVLIKE